MIAAKISIIIALIALAIAVYISLTPRRGDDRENGIQQERCVFHPNDYEDIEENPDVIRCRDFLGNLMFRWYDPIEDWTVQKFPDPGMAPSADQVCSEWCEQISLPNTCLHQSEEYRRCIERLTPKCSGSPENPVASNGDDLVSVIGRGKVGCF